MHVSFTQVTSEIGFQDCNDRPGCVFRCFRPGHPALPPSLQVSVAHELLGGIYGEPKTENEVLCQGLGVGRWEAGGAWQVLGQTCAYSTAGLRNSYKQC